MNQALSHKLDHLPLQPGVYIYKDKQGGILYVGKAKKLKNRVKSYFAGSRNLEHRIKVMVSKIEDLEIIVTDSESEALILEKNLIKKHAPRYNIMFRDDKTYPYICMTVGERPRVFPTRTVLRDGSRYWGPYDNVTSMRQVLETTRKAFDLCTCACSSKSINQQRGIPRWGSCFEDYFDHCSQHLPLDTYQDRMQQVVRLLNGKTASLIKELKESMHIASDAMAFEEAAKLRDGIDALERFSQRNKVVSSDPLDKDVFVVKTDPENNCACGVLFKIREGKLVSSMPKLIQAIEGISEHELLQGFMEEYYTSEFGDSLPDEIYTHTTLSDEEPLFEYLREVKGRRIPISVPQIGEKAQLVNMAMQNAQHHLKEFVIAKLNKEETRIPHAIQALKRDLLLDQLPRRIDCFDNSNLQGTDPVASMVCFYDGQPRKSEYKRFHIKTVEGPDDFASMREIVFRRYAKIANQPELWPNLVVIDGGKGQLSSAMEIFHQLNMVGAFPVIGLAKRLEEVFFPGSSDSIIIPKTSASLKLLQRIRDEAHRFAITFHRETRKKRTLVSELDQIPGVGPRTRDQLIKSFGSVKKIKEAYIEDLEVAVGKSMAKKIRTFFDQLE